MAGDAYSRREGEIRFEEMGRVVESPREDITLGVLTLSYILLICFIIMTISRSERN